MTHKTFFAVLALSFTGAHAETAAPSLYAVNTLQAAEAVSRALETQGAGERVKAVVTGKTSTRLYESDTPVDVQVATLQVDKNQRRWTGNLLFVANGEVVSAQPITGRYQELMAVPVLKRPVTQGQVITAADVDWAEFPASSMRGELVTDVQALIGQSPKRMISANRPIRMHEVGGAAVLRKGALVRLRYEAGTLSIATTGQTMEAGALGEIIAIRNVNSKQIVRARVESAESAVVVPLTTDAVKTASNEGVTHAAQF